MSQKIIKKNLKIIIIIENIHRMADHPILVIGGGSGLEVAESHPLLSA
jgi:putative NADH-flavin reductase